MATSAAAYWIFTVPFIILPFVSLHGLRLLFQTSSYKKKLLDETRPLYVVGGKSGIQLFHKSMVETGSRMITLFALCHLYLTIGALIMSSLETPAEEEAHEEFKAKMSSYKERVTPEVYDELVGDLGDPDAELWRNWDFSGSLYYCFTLITTIGYGSFGPSTTGGMLFTVFFVLTGVPLFLTTLAVTGSALPQMTLGWLFHWAEIKWQGVLRGCFAEYLDSKQPQPTIEEVKRKFREESELRPLRFVLDIIDGYLEEVDDNDGLVSAGELEKVMEKLIVLLIGEFTFGLFAALFIIWAIILPVTTGLAFLRPDADEEDQFSSAEALHWAIVTFSTVGLGDLVGLDSAHDSVWYGIMGNVGAWIWYVFLGLMILAVVINEAAEHMRLSSLHAVFCIGPVVLQEFFLVECYGRKPTTQASNEYAPTLEGSARVAPDQQADPVHSAVKEDS